MHANLEVCEGDVPVCRVVCDGAGYEQRVVLLQTADVLTVVGVGTRSVNIGGVERCLVGPVVVDVYAVQSEPVLPCRLIECVGHL